MVIISHQRDKCIGCNYCVEIAEHRWRMSKKDGKVTLIGGENRKGFHTARVENIEIDEADRAAEVCPMNIIKVKMI